MLPSMRLVTAIAASALIGGHAVSDLSTTPPGETCDSCRAGREEDDSGLLQVAHEVLSSEIAGHPHSCRQEGRRCQNHGHHQCCQGLECTPDKWGGEKTCVKACVQQGDACQTNGASGCCTGLMCTKKPFAMRNTCEPPPQCRLEGAACREDGPNECCRGLQCKKKPFSWQSTCQDPFQKPSTSSSARCLYGAHVECPGTPGKMCSGDQCCPAIPGSGGTFPCPSASPSYAKCQSTNKVANCLR